MQHLSVVRDTLSREAKKYIYSLAVLCFFISTAGAQENKTTISLLARADKDSIVLRWSPSTPGAWMELNRTGYVIERTTLSSDGNFDRKSYIKLVSRPLAPLKKEEWSARIKNLTKANLASPWEAAAEQALYGQPEHKATLSDLKDLRDQSNELDNRFIFALLAADNDPVAADGLAWRFVDHDIRSGSSYIYRIFSPGSGNEYLDTAYIVVDAKAYERSAPPSSINVEIGDGRLRLHWYENPLASYSGYYIDRSEDDGKTFKRLNKVPHITLQPKENHGREESEYIDTTVIDYRLYIYRLQGITPFGELSEPTEVSAMARDFTPPPSPQLPEAKIIGSQSVRLRWQMKNAPHDFAGFRISRSLNPTEGYSLLSSAGNDANEFVDTTAEKETLYYYVISSLDTAGNEAQSLPVSALIVDSLPPAIPIGLSGTIDTNGVVRLHWQASRDTKILGYRVLWSNDAKHEFAQRTPIIWKDTEYFDTINIRTLTPTIYYCVASVNLRHIHSDLSKILTLKRPDVIPPTQSVFTNVNVTDSSVILHWVRSRSEDLANQLLMRRKKQEGDPSSGWAVINSLGREDELYVDRKVEQLTTYEYRLITVDSSGLRSQPSAIVQCRPYDPGIRPEVKDLAVRFDTVTKSVLLKWSYSPIRKEDYWFIVYRSTEGRALAQYRAVKSDTPEFNDTEITSLPPYKYAVRVTTSSGAESKLSNTVTVNK